MIGEPSSLGAVHDTDAWPLPRVADTFEGASGADDGVTPGDAEEGAESPIMFVATTVNVYTVPFVRPETVTGDSEVDALKPPGDDVTV